MLLGRQTASFCLITSTCGQLSYRKRRNQRHQQMRMQLQFAPTKTRNKITHNKRVAHIIFNSISADLRPYISDLRDPAEMWGVLKNRCSNSTAAMERIALKIQFRNLTPTPGSPVTDFFAQITSIRNQLAGTPQAIDDDDLKVQLYSKPPAEFSTTVAYQQNVPEDTPIQNIMDNIKRDETMRGLKSFPAASSESLSGNTTSNDRSNRGRRRAREGARKQVSERTRERGFTRMMDSEITKNLTGTAGEPVTCQTAVQLKGRVKKYRETSGTGRQPRIPLASTTKRQSCSGYQVSWKGSLTRYRSDGGNIIALKCSTEARRR